MQCNQLPSAAGDERPTYFALFAFSNRCSKKMSSKVFGLGDLEFSDIALVTEHLALQEP